MRNINKECPTRTHQILDAIPVDHFATSDEILRCFSETWKHSDQFCICTLCDLGYVERESKEVVRYKRVLESLPPEAKPITTITPPSTGLTYTVIEWVNQRINSELAKMNEELIALRTALEAAPEEQQNKTGYESHKDSLEFKVYIEHSQKIGDLTALVKRLEAKVENLDSRLDLNVTARKELKMVQHKLADLDNRTRGDIRYGGVLSTPEITAKEFSKQLNPQPFDPTAFPKAEKQHNPQCLCKDCHEEKTLPPFQDVEKLNGGCYFKTVELIEEAKRGNWMVEVSRIEELLTNSRLDQRRIRMLAKTLNQIAESNIMTATIQGALHKAGCDKI